MIVEYVKKRDGRKVGVLIGKSDWEDGTISFGWSKYAEAKESGPFNKRKALEIAVNRAYACRPYAKEDLPFAIQKEFDRFKDRCTRYFKEAPVNMVE